MAKSVRGIAKTRGKVRGDLSSWHWRPPRASHVLDAARQVSIKRDEASEWLIVDGEGTVLARGFPSNGSAVEWMRRHPMRIKPRHSAS